MGMIFGIALMAGWRHMMGYRSSKRVAKVRFIEDFDEVLWLSLLFKTCSISMRLSYFMGMDFMSNY